MADAAGDDYVAARPTKFRLKSKKRSRRDEDARTHKRRHAHKSHDDDSRPRKRRRSIDGDAEGLNNYEAHPFRRPKPSPPVDDPSLYDDTYLPNSRSANFPGPDEGNVDPDTAFRESLFDALADDEGAAYWESVYGQPVHTYSRPSKSSPTGELEQMDDEEYAAYVRARMYEKTHQHIFEEKARREEARRRTREEEKIREERARIREEERRDREAWEARIADSLARQEQKGRSRRWKDAWESYLGGWEALKSRKLDDLSGGDAEDAHSRARKLIPWPTVTGRWKDVSKEDTEAFFRHAPGDRKGDLYTVLKAERVRWHPDKMMQRFGGTGIDQDTMKTVTAVFQVVDHMWSGMRNKS